MKSRKVNIAYLPKTKWRGDRAMELIDGYKLYNARKNNARNEVVSNR